MTVWATMSPEQKARKLFTYKMYRQRDIEAARQRSRESYRRRRERQGLPYTPAAEREPNPAFIGPKRPRGRPRKYPAEQSTDAEAAANGAADN